MADLSHLRPVSMWRETRAPAMATDEAPSTLSAEAAQWQSALTDLRERARRRLVDAYSLLALGVGAFAMAVATTQSEDAPDWLTGLCIGSYAVAAMAGGLKYLSSADDILLMRDLQSTTPALAAGPQPDGNDMQPGADRPPADPPPAAPLL